jgi:aryl-alcohol dehydrogenase-like predicted oxidoreductase
MEYRKLGNSGLRVSAIGLGCNGFGSRYDESTALGIIERAVELGVNFIDTANAYSEGRSEEIVGKGLKGKRSKIVLATKFGHHRTLGPADQGGSRNNILASVEASLKRLNTNYIDLYYIHQPDPQTPIAETLRTLNDLVRSGKVRYISCSNFAAWELCEAIWTSRLQNRVPFIAIQSKYNMLERGIEREVAPCCQSCGVSVVPWQPLAGGFLTGKYRRGEPMPKGARLSKARGIDAGTMTDANYDKVAKLEAFAKERGHNVGDLAIAWLLAHPWLGSVIAGVANPEQLKVNITGADWKLTPEDMAQLDKML